VDEPSKYGVVVHEPEGRIRHFVEKPQTFVGNHINAGMYVFSPSVLDLIPAAVPMSLEKEVFPVLADQGQLYAMVLPGYWMDIGQPKDYVLGMCLHLASLRKRAPARLAAGDGIKGDVLIHPSAKIGTGCLIGPNVVVGPNCVVGDGARLTKCTLLSDVTVGAHACVTNAIIGWHCAIGKWSRVEGGAVFGEDVQLADEAAVNGAIILPHKGIKESLYSPGTIVM
jgi:mannose-1-phosphate guanylyltransferase